MRLGDLCLGIGDLLVRRTRYENIELGLRRVTLCGSGQHVRSTGTNLVSVCPGQQFVETRLGRRQCLVGGLEVEARLFLGRAQRRTDLLLLAGWQLETETRQHHVIRIRSRLLLRNRRGQVGLGGSDLRIASADHDLIEVGSGGAHLCLGSAHVRLGCRDFLRPRPCPKLRQLRLGQRQSRLRLFHLQLQPSRVQPCQHIACFDRVSHFHRHLGHPAGGLEIEAHAGLWLDGATGRDGDEHRAPFCEGRAAPLLRRSRGLRAPKDHADYACDQNHA